MSKHTRRHRLSTTLWTRSRVAIVATAAALIALVAPIAIPAATFAAGTGVLTVTMEPVTTTTGIPQTLAGGGNTTLGYRISYSCSVGDCLGATIQVSPGPTDPTYNTYRHLLYSTWTAPFLGATIGGTNVTGKLVTLGDLTAGASGSFTLGYTWALTGNAVTATIQAAQFFPNGFQLVMSAAGASSSITNAPTATAAPVTWLSTIRSPSLGQAAMGTYDSGVNVAYKISMTSGCLPTVATAPKGDSRYTCAKSYVVTDYLDPRATFVSASHGGVYTAATHSVTWTAPPAVGVAYPAPAPGWYAPGSSDLTVERTMTVRYDPEDFSPSGTDASYCDFTQGVSNRVTMHMVYPGVGGMPDDTNFRDLEAIRAHNVACVNPFAKAIFNSKVSTFDGPNRYSNGNSPIVVQPDAQPNQQRWDISVGNQSNVPGVAVIQETDLAIQGTKPYQIQATNGAAVQANNATIAWTLNTGVSGTSMGIADAPTGTWFTAMTVTSGPLAGPNLLTTGTNQTTFLARVRYNVTGDAPIDQTRTNTATAQMTYPDYPTVPTIDLGSKSHTLQYLAAFGRGSTFKGTDTVNVTSVTIPTTGSVSHFWRIVVRNTGNVPGVGIIDDLNLASSGQKVTSVTASATGVTTGATVQYTLNTGVTGTAAVPFTAPAGTWITGIHLTTSVIEPVNALPAQTLVTSYYEVHLVYAVASTTTPASTWTNTAQTTMTYPGMGVASVPLTDATATVTFAAPGAADDRPRIAAQFVGTPVVEGGGQAVPGRNVTYTVRGTSSNIVVGDTYSPQYIFVAPVNWMVVPGSASFATGAVPPGVVFTYKNVTISGVVRQAVVATWPSGATFGANVTLPSMTVVSQPTSLAAASSTGTAVALIGESTHNWNTTEAVFTGAYTDITDFDADGLITEGWAVVSSAALTVGSASQLTVVKEICFPDTSATDGCEWVAEPGAVVGVAPAATNIEYRVRLVNSGNTSLTSVVAYDVLPYIGDTGTSAATAATPRGSTFRETLSEIVSVTGLTVSYSDSSNPCRTEVYAAGPVGCVSDWDAASSAALGAQAIRLTASAALAPGDSVSVHYKAAVVSGAAADAIACNSVAAKAAQIGVPAEPLAVCATTQEADLSIVVPSRLPLQVGRTGLLPFTVTNHGGSLSAPAVVDVQIPADVQIASLTPSGWDCVSSTGALVGPLELVCSAVNSDGTARTLAKDVPDALVVSVIPTSGTSLCVDADVHGRMSDPVSANNDATGCVTVAAAAPELLLTKSDARTTAARGDELTYTLTVGNGLVGEALTDVVLTDALPAELEFVSASDGGTLTAGVVTWPSIDVAASGVPNATGDGVTGGAGSTVTRTVTVRVSDTATGSLVNSALAAVADPSGSGSTLTASAADTDELLMYTVSKSVNAPAVGVYAGDELTYTVVASNVGTAPFPSAYIRDVLADVLDDATFVSGSAAVVVTGQSAAALANPVGGVLSWSGTLPTAGTATITYRVTVGSSGDGVIANSVFTSSTGALCDAATGKDSSGAPCAATETGFGPLVSKTVDSLTQNDNGTWTTVYGIDVVNRNAASSATYSLTDQLKFGSGITVIGTPVVTGPAGVSILAWTGSGTLTTGVTLPAGATHSYTVSVVADAHALAGTAAASCATGLASGFANVATIGLVDGRTAASETCAEPVAPSVTKTAAPVVQNVDGSWTEVYTVAVTAPASAPAAGLAYTLGDLFDFPASVAVLSTTIIGPAGAPINNAFTGAAGSGLLTAADRVAAGATRTFTVSVVTDVPAGSVTGSDLACAPAGVGGYANTVSLFSGSGTTVLDTADACERVIAQPTPTITKTVAQTSINSATGDWTIVYELTVTNPDAAYSTSYELDDELQFGAGITVVNAQVSSADAPVSSTWNGDSQTLIASGVALPAGATHVYAVTAIATPPAVIDAANEAAMDCRLDAPETGTGFRNVATLGVGVVTPSPFAIGCEAAADPSVVKTTHGAPVQDALTGIWTAEYEITVSNRSTTTVGGGIPYSLDDIFGFPTGTVVSDVSVAGPGTLNPDFDGSTDVQLATGAIAAAVDDTTPRTHVYTVVVSFTVPAGITAGARQCDVSQGAGGLRNEVEIQVGSRTTADVACADAPQQPVMGISKSVLSEQQQADGTWEVLYRVTVANPSTTVAGRYDLLDELSVGTGITVLGTPTIVAQPAGVTVNHSTWDGATSSAISENILLGAGASHNYTVRAVLDSAAVRGTDTAGDCTLATGEPGTGFLNSATAVSGIAERSATACVTAFDPAVSKTVNGVPVRNGDGSWTVSYVITVDNPSATADLSYGLDDELAFPSGTVVTSTVVVGRAGAPTTSSSWDGATDLVVVPSGTPLVAGGRHVFDVTVVAVLPVGQDSIAGGWANGATVRSSTSDLVITAVGAAADVELPELTITKTAVASPLLEIGDTVDYTIHIENTGLGSYTSTYPGEVWDDLGDVLDDASLSAPATVTPALGSVTAVAQRLHWSGGLATGQSVDLSYTVVITGDGNQLLENVAFAGEHGVVPATPTSCAGTECATTSTALPGFLLEKSASVGVVQPGGRITYTVVYLNTGSVDVPTANFSDDLSDVLDDAQLIGSAFATSGSVAIAGTALEWSGPLDSGESVTVTYVVEVASLMVGDGSLTNIATMDPRFAPRCPDASATCTAPERTAEVLTSVRALAFTKSASTSLANYGQNITYVVTVTNISPTAYTVADPAVVVDSMSGLLDDAVYNGDVVATAGAAIASATEIEWSGALAGGDSVTFEYSVRINDSKTGDGLLGNIVGLAGTQLPTSAFLECDPAAVGNAGEFCFVSVAVSPLAFTGVTVDGLVLIALALLLLGLILLGIRKVMRSSRVAHRKARA